MDLTPPGVSGLSCIGLPPAINVINIQWSSDCQLWDLLLTLTNNGQMQYFADPDAVSQPMRFYRAVAQP